MIAIVESSVPPFGPTTHCSLLQGSGGVADHIREIIDFCKKPTRGTLVFEKDPDRLVQKCLRALNRS